MVTFSVIIGTDSQSAEMGIDFYFSINDIP